MAIGLASWLTGCTATNNQEVQPAGFRTEGVAELIPYRMLEAINAVRQREGRSPLQLSAELNAAAKTHAHDMNLQNRPWHFGSDGSSPVDRVSRVGYRGWLIGEAISESFETDLETLLAWMGEEEARAMMLDPEARRIGVGWYQRESGKTWWTLVVGG